LLRRAGTLQSWPRCAELGGVGTTDAYFLARESFARTFEGARGRSGRDVLAVQNSVELEETH